MIELKIQRGNGINGFVLFLKIAGLEDFKNNDMIIRVVIVFRIFRGC